jgi:hypothetical protein
MMDTTCHKIIFALFSILFFSCAKEIIETQSKILHDTKVVFLNDKDAYDYHKHNSSYIKNQIQQIDLSIILEEDYGAASLSEVRELYLKNLKENTLNWTAKEIENFEPILKDIIREIKTQTPKVLPDTLFMIKTTGKETVSNGAMYTTAKSITIPKVNTRSAGLGFIEDEVKETLIHELFHIYSNLHKSERALLYDIVGFREVALDIGAYKSRIIANPDADYDWAINLELGGETIQAVLLTYSKFERWEGNKSPLGLKPGNGYLTHGLFQVENKNGTYILTNGLNPKEDEETLKAFEHKIGTNTSYTWAVEEIMADTYPLIFNKEKVEGDLNLEIVNRLEQLLQ